MISLRRRVAAPLLALAALVLMPLSAAASTTAPTTPSPTSTTTSTASPPSTASPAAAGGTIPGPLVLIGTGGVRWNDVDSSTPSMYAFLDQGSSGWVAVRSVRSTTCPVDGWLAVSAGRRAADQEVGPGAGQKSAACRQPAVTVATPGAAGVVPQWGDYEKAIAGQTFDSTAGLLGDTVAAAGKTAIAVGPGAAIALARSNGSADHAYAGLTNGGTGTDTDAQKLGADVQAAVKQNPDLLVIDIGSVRDPAQLAQGEPTPTGVYAKSRKDQVTELNTRLTLVLGALPSTSTVILASISDSGDRSMLQLAGAVGPSVTNPKDSYRTSLLGSESTRQNGVVQTTDLLPTLTQAIGVDTPVDAVGSPLMPVAKGRTTADRLEHLDDIDRAARAVTPIVPWFFNGLVISQVLLYGLITVVLRRRSRYTNSLGGPSSPAAAHLRTRTLTWMRVLTVIFACFPAATFLANLVPWWRAGNPGLAVTGCVLAFVLPMALIALLGPWRRSFLGCMGVVGAETAIVVGGDVVTGSHLMFSSLMGVQPVVAGRFYGFGNPAFALFATGALLAAIAVADWLVKKDQVRAAVIAIAAIAAVATIVDGTPGLGSDFGGPPAIIPAFAVLGLMVAGVSVTWRRALIITGVTIGVLVVLMVADWLRPAADRTHLGRFVQTVIDGGAWAVIQRKGEQNLHILFTSWLSALLPFATAFVLLVLARPVAWGARPLQLAYTRSPALKHGMIALPVMILIGFALNDSGTTVPAVAATVAIPLLISVSARALQLHDAEELEAAIARTRRPKRQPR